MFIFLSARSCSCSEMAFLLTYLCSPIYKMHRFSVMFSVLFRNVSDFVIGLRKLKIFVFSYCIEESYVQVHHVWLGELLSSCAFNCSFICFRRESGPWKEEAKTVVPSARLLRSRFQRPKPNLRTTGRKEVLDVNNKGVAQKDINTEESLTQFDNECSILLDTDVRHFAFFFFSFSYVGALRFVKWNTNDLKIQS